MIAAALQLTVQTAGRLARPVVGLALDVLLGDDDGSMDGYVSPTRSPECESDRPQPRTRAWCA